MRCEARLSRPTCRRRLRLAVSSCCAGIVFSMRKVKMGRDERVQAHLGGGRRRGGEAVAASEFGAWR